MVERSLLQDLLTESHSFVKTFRRIRATLPTYMFEPEFQICRLIYHCPKSVGVIPRRQLQCLFVGGYSKLEIFDIPKELESPAQTCDGPN